MASSSSSSTRPWTYDVFLSFRGPDTRKGIASDIYDRLKDIGIKTFMDDPDLQVGDAISPTLIAAIKESRFAIVVLSQDYASSTWCLDELREICLSMGENRILPLFFEVNPTDVRYQKRSFQEAFCKHDTYERHESEKVNQWRAALEKVAKISGWNSDNFKTHRELINKIVEDLCSKVQPDPTEFKGDFQAYEPTKEAMYRFLKALTNDKITAVGVHGMGGVGKTTMVKQKYVMQDQPWCRVPELPEVIVGWEAPLEKLKTKLLGDDGVTMLVLTAPGGCGKTTLATKFCTDQQVKDEFGEDIYFVTVSKKYSLNSIVEQLYRRKGSQVPTLQNEVIAVQWLQAFLKEEGKKPLLLVLDDVWSGSDSLLSNFDCKMAKMKVLVTSRSEFRALCPPYHLEMLGFDDAMTLFHHSASLGDKSSHIPPKLSRKIVERCKGFPLAIKVVGRSLCAQPIEMWQNRLNQWSKGSLILDFETDLLFSLQSSLDALDKERAIIKECFLDLGSFPEDERIPVYALIDIWSELYDTDDDTSCVATLYELKNRSLANLIDYREVKLDGEGYYGHHYVTQHDLLRELAIYHSKLESPDRRERLFIDICGSSLPKWWREKKYQVLKARLLSISSDGESSALKWPNMHLPETEALVLNLRDIEGDIEEYSIPEFVEKMTNLKVLVITRESFNFGTCGLTNPQLLSCLSNLKRIRLERVSLSSILKNSIQVKSLRKLSLIHCDFQSASIMDLSQAFPNLEEMYLECTFGMQLLLKGLGDLICLKKLTIRGSPLNLDDFFPEEIGNLVNLEELRLMYLMKLLGRRGPIKFPDSTRNLQKLNTLCLYKCDIVELPECIGEMRSLRKLDLRGCVRLKKLPPSVLDLEQLEEVICDCNSERLWQPLLPSLRDKNRDISIVNCTPRPHCV